MRAAGPGRGPHAASGSSPRSRPGVTTGELDALAEESIRDEGAVPSFLGYHGFPGSICASAGAEVVHGIPSAPRVAARGRAAVDRLRRDPRRLARRRRGHACRWGSAPPSCSRCRGSPSRRCGPASPPCRPGGRLSDIGAAVESRRAARTATACSRTTPATASAPRCTSRRTCPTSRRRARAGAWCSSRASCWPSSRWSTLGSPDVVELDDGWTVVTARRPAGRALGAHRRGHARRPVGAHRARRRRRAARRCPRAAEPARCDATARWTCARGRT